jgi:flagellin-specific chaperone FliS
MTFETFINKLKTDESSNLLEHVLLGYKVIFESFKDAADIVLPTVEYITSTVPKIKQSNPKNPAYKYLHYDTPLMGELVFLIIPNQDNIISAKSDGNKRFRIIDNELRSMVQHGQIDDIPVYMKANLYDILAHELAHEYEISIRGISNVVDQIHNMSDKSRERYNKNNYAHHNHKLEKLPNSLSELSKVLNLNISNDEKVRMVRSSEVFNHLSSENKKKLLKQVTTYLGDI